MVQRDPWKELALYATGLPPQRVQPSFTANVQNALQGVNQLGLVGQAVTDEMIKAPPRAAWNYLKMAEQALSGNIIDPLEMVPATTELALNVPLAAGLRGLAGPPRNTLFGGIPGWESKFNDEMMGGDIDSLLEQLGKTLKPAEQPPQVPFYSGNPQVDKELHQLTAFGADPKAYYDYMSKDLGIDMTPEDWKGLITNDIQNVFEPGYHKTIPELQQFQTPQAPMVNVQKAFNALEKDPDNIAAQNDYAMMLNELSGPDYNAWVKGIPQDKLGIHNKGAWGGVDPDWEDVIKNEIEVKPEKAVLLPPGIEELNAGLNMFWDKAGIKSQDQFKQTLASLPEENYIEWHDQLTPEQKHQMDVMYGYKPASSAQVDPRFGALTGDYLDPVFHSRNFNDVLSILGALGRDPNEVNAALTPFDIGERVELSAPFLNLLTQARNREIEVPTLISRSSARPQGPYREVPAIEHSPEGRFDPTQIPETFQGDEEAFARAVAMGFDPSQMFYHSSQALFPAFRKKMEWTRSEPAIFAAPDPEISAGYGRYTYPVHLRMQNPLEFDWGGKEYSGARMDAAINDAIQNDFDALIVRNILDTGPIGGYGQTKQDQFLVFDPSQVRSTWANFDPAKLASPDLLASIGGPAALFALLQGLSEDDRKSF